MNKHIKKGVVKSLVKTEEKSLDELIKLISSLNSKNVNKDLEKAILKAEDEIDERSGYKELKDLKKCFNQLLELFDKQSDDVILKKFSNYGKTRAEIKEKLLETSEELEDMLSRIEYKKQKSFKPLVDKVKNEIHKSNQIICYNKRSILMFWCNVIACICGIVGGVWITNLNSFKYNLIFAIVFFSLSVVLFVVYIVNKVISWKLIGDKFKHLQAVPMFLIVILFEIISLLDVLFKINISNNPVLFYISLILNSIYIGLGIGPFVKFCKFAEGYGSSFGLALSLSVLLLIFEKSFGAYMPIPDWGINALLVVTFIIWSSSLILNSILLNKNSKNNFHYVMLFIEILFVFALGFFTVYRIFHHDNDLFNNISTLYASLCGGGLTLGGVAWTIRSQDKFRKEEKITELKPYITIAKPTKDRTQSYFIPRKQLKKIQLLSPDDVINTKKIPGMRFYLIEDIYIRNSLNSNIIFDSVIINGERVEIEYDNFIEKGNVFAINSMFYFYLQDFEMQIVLLDVNENKYSYKLSFDGDGVDECIEEYFFSNNPSKKKKIKYFKLKAKLIEPIK